MEPFKILVLNNISNAGLERLSSHLYVVGREMSDPQGILVRSHNMHDMEMPGSLLAVGRAGAGVNNIPVERLTEMGIPVFNAPGANANAVKELVIGAMLLAARNLIPAWDYLRALDLSSDDISKDIEAGKKKFLGFELPGRTLGVIGLGAVGVEVANAALSLGMNVIGYDPEVTVERAWQLSSGVKQAGDLEELCSRVDIVTSHVPYNENTRGMLNRARLALLPRGAVVLNFARAEVVDEQAIGAALSSGAVSTYVTDFPSRSLMNCEGVICLPHLGASTREAEENCAIMVVENLRDFIENGNISSSVNFPQALLRRTRPHRLAVTNANVPNMVGQISTALAEEKINIADLLNVSRGDVAHTIVDLDGPAGEKTLQRIRAIDGILMTRVLPIID